MRTFNSSIPALIMAITLSLAACGASKPAPEATTPAPEATTAEPAATPAAAPSEAKDTCVAMFVRQRECTDAYIPALVDLRIRLDVPAGIAQMAEDQGRDALITKAKEEWQGDSTDQAISATCDSIMASLPAEQKDQTVQAAASCLEQTECEPFVGCVMALHEAHLGKH